MRLYMILAGDEPRIAVKADGSFIDLRKAYEQALVREGACHSERAAKALASALLPGDMRQYIEMGPKGREAAEVAVRFASQVAKGDRAPWRLKGDEVKVLAPITNPGKFVCIGLNYAKHAEEVKARIPTEPIFFSKYPTSIIGPDEPILHQGPPITEQLDYEVELAVVIGRRARNVSEREAEQFIFGYTIVNDVSARDLQFRDGQWVKGKALDTYAPLGPCIVTRDAIDVSNLAIRTRVNGAIRQDSFTSDLIFTIPQIIAFLSRLFTLEPGDIISTGTPSGVATSMDPPGYLQPGDVVECEIEGIGVLRNPVVGPADPMPAR